MSEPDSAAVLRVMRTTKVKKTREDLVIDIFTYVSAAIVFAVCFYPFYLSIVLAFNEGKDALLGGIYLWPRKATLINFAQLISDHAWTEALGITALRTVIGTVVTVFFTALVSYGLSSRELVFRKLYLSLIIFAMYFSGGVIPYFMVLRSLGLINNFLVYIIPGAVNLFYVLVAISFFQSIPKELAESARMDGAGELRIFTQIILQVSKPLLATIAIFTAVGHWNSWYDCAFFTQDKILRTMGYMLMSIINQTSNTQMTATSAAASTANQSITNLSLQLAAMIVAVAPILIVYPYFQKYFITGLTLGSVKG
ncbi:MAG: carbohydrate ABC transporter permease [Spirochaetia bacterium]